MTDDHYPLLKVVLLAGGVGGAKMAAGLAQVIAPENLFIIGNTADDFEHLSLLISPDLDTVMYTLAGLNNPETGWGLANETWNTLAALGQFSGPTWFNLGDKDLAIHLIRTQWLRSGYPLSWVTAQLCRRLGIKSTLMPMTDNPVKTIIHTGEGKLSFQEYFVRHQCRPVAQKVEFAGASAATINRDILTAVRMADVIVFAPSNPLLSIDPILALPGLRRLISASRAAKIGISPIIQGKTVKGPAAKVMQELGLEASAFGVADYLRDVLTGYVFEPTDAVHLPRIQNLGLKTFVTNTIMPTLTEQTRLAREVLNFAISH